VLRTSGVATSFLFGWRLWRDGDIWKRLIRVGTAAEQGGLSPWNEDATELRPAVLSVRAPDVRRLD